MRIAGAWILALGLLGVTTAVAQTRPVVVELFTSEGCSSCPPAEAFLGSVTMRDDVLPLAFHVNYWDDLGWRDRFALGLSVARQEAYARRLGTPVYTPQVVIDGARDPGTGYVAALSDARREPAVMPLSIEVRDGQVIVAVGAGAGAPPADVELVAYLRHAVSAVGRGENAGRTLEHFNTVRALRSLGTWRGEALTLRVPVSSMPQEATHVAVLVQQRGQGAIVGAASRALR